MSAHLFVAVAIMLTHPTALTSGQPAPAGHWRGVDLVRNVEDFTPATRSYKGELLIKEFRCSDTGQTSLGWTCANGWTVHADGKTKHRYLLQRLDGDEYLFLPWLSGDVTVRGHKPWYYVLRKAAGPGEEPKQQQGTTQPGASFQAIRPVDRVGQYDDVRWRDLSRLNLADRAELLPTLRFNEKTIWPRLLAMPQGCFPRKILTDAMNPGLGIRELHGRGITGRGVNVAVIDQPLFPDHPEFAGKIAAYRDVGCRSQSSMHGPAVASLLVGRNCGTAPDARVYYVAVLSGTKDAEYYAKALDWILQRNERLRRDEKIRVVSVSAAPSGPGSPFVKNQDAWEQACKRAAGHGVLVLDCTSHRGFVRSCYYDATDPEDVSKCKPGFPGRSWGGVSGKLLVPSSPRTTAEQYNKAEHSYQYYGRGGLSWSIPYCAGVLALGWQVRPDLTAAQMRENLFKSALVTEGGEKIINPKEFIRAVQSVEKDSSQ